MESRNEKESFRFTYSAREQEELKRIRQKYQPQEENKMEQLRRLDAGVTRKATVFSLVVGIVGALVMGSGMSLAMTELAAILGMTQNTGMTVGIIVGLLGLTALGFAYPIYIKTLHKEREKIAPEIIRLTDELLK